MDNITYLFINSVVVTENTTLINLTMIPCSDYRPTMVVGVVKTVGVVKCPDFLFQKLGSYVCISGLEPTRDFKLGCRCKA